MEFNGMSLSVINSFGEILTFGFEYLPAQNKCVAFFIGSKKKNEDKIRIDDERKTLKYWMFD